jgi:hypothetical protein
MFQWDSLSLKRMPASAICRSEENDLDWTTMGLYPEEVEKAEPRDTQADVDEIFETWQEYLEAHLKLPFEPVVSEFQERGPLHAGDLVKVIGFEGVEDLYGVLVSIKARGNAYVFPLCDLKAANEKSANFPLTDDYAVWFANR